MRQLFLALALSLGLSGAVLAQQNTAPTVQQIGTRLDALTSTAVSTNYNTVNTQAVATVTPPAGQYAYITRIELEAIQDGTSTACVNCAFTSSGLGSGATASPQWGFSIAATADAVVFRDVNFGASPLRSAAPGTNVTITSPTAKTDLAFGIKVYYYTSP
jgi:hypothetical protein